MFGKSHTLFRPPAEADSLIIRVADGCPWNGCTFCGMYKGVPYKFQGLEKIESIFSRHWKNRPDARRIFLADGDVMHLDLPLPSVTATHLHGLSRSARVQTLEKILTLINHTFQSVVRIGVYANGTSILAKTDAELRRLKELKLHTLYMGMESGDNETLHAMNKRETAEEMVEAGRRAQAAGLRMSVMVLIGLAGKERSLEHARATAEALNRMQPRLLSALRLIPVPGTPLYDGGRGFQPLARGKDASSTFKMLTEHHAMLELREMIQGLELEQTVFRADHSSNIIPLEGRFPKDKERLLAQLDALLNSGQLDRNSPGRLPWSL